jgi:UDP-N-acetylmuramyl pentapeptide phosphotransferase/UDP-N-acetylglucosamine-1-phosphate transferase
MRSDPIWIFLGAALVSAVVILFVRGFALRARLLDIPNERSAHTVPIPRLGGVGLVCGVWAVALAASTVRAHPMLWMALFSTLPLYLLIYDDILAAFGGRLTQMPKFATQLTASVLFVLKSGFVLHTLTLPGLGQIHLGWAAVPATFLWLLYVTNIYNFMDGLDGLAGSQGFLIATTLFGIATTAGSSSLSLLTLAVAGASTGFLIFNRPPATIIMGDVGSAFLGFLLAAFGVLGEREGVSFLTMPILLAPFLFDATYTLLRRLLRGEDIFQAHRFHLYQRLSRLGIDTALVNTLYVAALLPCGLGAAFLNQGRVSAALTAFAAFLAFGIAGTWWVERAWNQKVGGVQLNAPTGPPAPTPPPPPPTPPPPSPNPQPLFLWPTKPSSPAATSAPSGAGAASRSRPGSPCSAWPSAWRPSSSSSPS